jgi:hypothetical protein
LYTAPTCADSDEEVEWDRKTCPAAQRRHFHRGVSDFGGDAVDHVGGDGFGEVGELSMQLGLCQRDGPAPRRFIELKG